MDAIKLLIEDHKHVEDLFLEFNAATDTTQKAELAEKICKELTVHATVEEELFYPAAREVFEAEEEKLIDEAVEEHAAAKRLIATIKTLSTGSMLDSEMKRLETAINHHVEEEETEMFPRLEKMGMETKHLGAEMMARKQQLMETL